MLATFFSELTVVLIITFFLAVIFNKLKLPTILAYIFAGLLVGPIGLLGSDFISDISSFEYLSKIGITLLLFLLGLEIKIGDLRSVGKVSLVTGLGQIIFTTGIGYLLSMLLGFEMLESLYIAIALTFSSTIVIVKLLSDSKQINTLHGRISIGFLLIQDLVAIAALVILNGLNQPGAGSIEIVEVLLVVIKAILAFILVIIISRHFIPDLVRHFSDSLELLFIFSLAWAFGVSWLMSSELVGLSIEIGGFLAGLALANTMESFQIISKVKALRDFFIVIFFVSLGLGMQLDNFIASIAPAGIFSLFVLIGNPLIVLILLGLMGYRAKTGFLSGLTVAQISEFSLIVIYLGRTLGHVSDAAVSIVTFTGIITFAVSAYMILKGSKLYHRLEPLLKKFERKQLHLDSAQQAEKLSGHIVVIGAHKMGSSVLRGLKKFKSRDVLIVDFNPEIAHDYADTDFRFVYGDITENEVQEKACLEEAKYVISTIPSMEDTMILLSIMKHVNPDAILITIATEKVQKKVYLRAGADKVFEPYVLAGELVAEKLQKGSFRKRKSN